MARDFSIVKIEDEADASKENFSIPRPGIHPSASSVEFYHQGERVVEGYCLRQIWYKNMMRFFGAKLLKKDISINFARAGKLGKWIERGILEDWAKAGILIDNNIKFYDHKYQMSGEMDAIIRSKETGLLTGVEIKTFAGYAAEKLLFGVSRERGSNKRMAGRPRDYQFLQSCIYAWKYRNRFDNFRLYYHSREYGKRCEFEITFEKRDDNRHTCCWEQVKGGDFKVLDDGPVRMPYAIEDVYDRSVKLLGYINKKELPPRDYQEECSPERVSALYDLDKVSFAKHRDWEKDPEKNKIQDKACEYCDFREQCMMDDLTF